MRHTITRWSSIAVAAAALLAVGVFAVTAGADPSTTIDRAWAGAPRFSHPGRIDNRYLPLTRRTRCELRGKADDGTRERSVKTVLERTKRFTVGGRRVEAVVIQDNAYEDTKLVESTLDYYAQADDGTVYYFGEQVKNLANGKVVDTHGTWLYGKDTDRLGIAMPARPTLGRQWHFEDVPGLTTESNRVEEVGLRTKVNGRVMSDVIRVQEFIQPEGAVEYKLYAAGIGSVAEYPPGARIALAGCR